MRLGAPPPARRADALRRHLHRRRERGHLPLPLRRGALSLEGVTPGVVNPSFLAVGASGRTLYAVNETTEFEGAASGAVSAFAVDASSGALTLLGQQASRGGAPCHLSLDRSGRFVLVANYVGGNVAVLPVEADGRLGAAVEVAQRSGTGPNAERQEAPHAHRVETDPANRHALVADLGTDRLAVYRFDAATGALALASEAPLAPGAGPRHFAFSPDGRRVYVLNELDSTLAAFGYADGALTPQQTLSTLPAGFAETSSAPTSSPRPTAASSTPRTAATTASPCSRSALPGRSRSSSTSRRAGSARATSRSTRRGASCSRPTRTAGPW